MLVEIQKLPADVAELQALPEAALQKPEHTAALHFAALTRYESNPQAALDMVNFLRGPEPLSVHDQQFIRDRLAGKAYVVRSYFRGATPDNDYEPALPYAVEITDNMYSSTEEGRARLFAVSGGADNPRTISLRLKPSTGQWFLTEHLGCLSDVRQPTSQDPWA